MFSSCIAALSHLWTYLVENLSCLSYGLEVFLHKYLINFSCYDLLVDISESFGIWVVLFILLNASLVLTTLIHSYGNNNKSSVAVSQSNNKKLSFTSFVRFVTLSKNKL